MKTSNSFNRFKMEYNDLQQNYVEEKSLINSNSNNIVFMQKKIYKNISTSKLQLLKQKYLINENMKKQKILYLQKNIHKVSQSQENLQIQNQDQYQVQDNDEWNNFYEDDEKIELPIIDLDNELEKNCVWKSTDNIDINNTETLIYEQIL